MKNIGGIQVKIKESSIKKMCSFYVSDWHLTTMLLPYVSKVVEKETKIETILENGIDKNIKELISKLNMNPDTKQKIMNINWNSSKIDENIVKKYKQEQKEKKIILVNGTRETINHVNDILEQELNSKEKGNVTIVNCYDVTEMEDNVQEILEQHDNIINTSGKHPIKEVFHFFDHSNH